MNKLMIKKYKMIRKNKKMNLPILSENRSNREVRYRNYHYIDTQNFSAKYWLCSDAAP